MGGRAESKRARTGYPLRLGNLLLLLRINVRLVLHVFVLLERLTCACEVVVALLLVLLFSLVIARLLELIPNSPHALLVVVGHLFVLVRRRVLVVRPAAAEERLEPTAGQALERRLVEPHCRLPALRVGREDLVRLELGQEAGRLGGLGRGRGDACALLRRRCGDRGGLLRLGLVLAVGRVVVARRLGRRVKVLLRLGRVGARRALVVRVLDATELAALLHGALAPLLLDLVLVVALELGLLVRLVQQVERLLEPPRAPLVVRHILVLGAVFLRGVSGDHLARAHALILRLLRLRRARVLLVARLALVVAREAAAAHAAALLAALDLAEVKHLGRHAVLLLETDVHGRDHVELHALHLALLLLVDAAALTTLLHRLVVGKALELWMAQSWSVQV